MKNYLVCLSIGLLSIVVQAQEDWFITNEPQDNGYINSPDEEATQATLMILGKESNLPVCRFSDQVRVNSEFVPENRIGNVDTTSIEEVRVCQEEDIWATVEEEMTVGMAIGGTPITFLASQIGKHALVSSIAGCSIGFIIEALNKTTVFNISNEGSSKFMSSLISLTVAAFGATYWIPPPPEVLRTVSNASILTGTVIVSAHISKEICNTVAEELENEASIPMKIVVSPH